VFVAKRGDALVTYWRLYYHFIWGTRLREPVIDERRIETIERAIRLVSNEVHAIPHAIGMMRDHVHVAISVPPKISISAFAQRLKGDSSRLVNLSESELNLGTFR
jgi:putative transposase